MFFRSLFSLLVIGIAVATLVVAEEEQSTHPADIEATKNIGIAASGAAGAMIGGAVGGMVGGPPGAAVGAAVGAGVGAMGAIEGNRRYDRAIRANQSESSWGDGDGVLLPSNELPAVGGGGGGGGGKPDEGFYIHHLVQ